MAQYNILIVHKEENGMKKKKVCALLCAVALSTVPVTPNMAADNTTDAQITVESDEVKTEEQTIAETEDEDNVNIADESDTEVASQEEQNEGIENDATFNEQTSEADLVKDEVNQNNEDEESDIPTDGWYKKN